MLEIAMARTGASPHETAIIGDGLLTDILAGERAGVTKILLLTGVATQDDVAGAPAQPDFIFEGLPALQQALMGDPDTSGSGTGAVTNVSH